MAKVLPADRPYFSLKVSLGKDAVSDAVNRPKNQASILQMFSFEITLIDEQENNLL